MEIMESYLLISVIGGLGRGERPAANRCFFGGGLDAVLDFHDAARQLEDLPLEALAVVLPLRRGHSHVAPGRMQTTLEAMLLGRETFSHCCSQYSSARMFWPANLQVD